MTHEEFMNMYNDELRHGWVTSKDSSVAAKQKQREKEYNHQYYLKNKDKWSATDSFDKADVEVARAADKLAGRSDLEIDVHTLQIKARKAVDKISDALYLMKAEKAGASSTTANLLLGERIAERDARRAKEAGQRAIDRLNGANELEVAINHMGRKASKIIEKAKPYVNKIIGAAEGLYAITLGGKSAAEANAQYTKRTGEAGIFSGGETKNTTVTRQLSANERYKLSKKNGS